MQDWNGASPVYWGLSEAGSWSCIDDPLSGGWHWGRSHNQKDAGKEGEALTRIIRITHFFGSLSDEFFPLNIT